MDNEQGMGAAARTPGDDFSRAWAAWESGLADYWTARNLLDEAQQRQVAAINELPIAERADMAKLEAIGDDIGISEAGDRVATLLNTIDGLFDTMINTPAPTPFALFLKLEAVGKVPWAGPSEEAGMHLARLTADAGHVALQTAEAWIDRWRALGGDFGTMQGPGDAPRRATRGMLVDLDYWKPSDRGRSDLHPSAWLTEERQHEGGVKVLEGMLELVPGLQAAVFALVTPTLPGLQEAA